MWIPTPKGVSTFTPMPELEQTVSGLHRKGRRNPLPYSSIVAGVDGHATLLESRLYAVYEPALDESGDRGICVRDLAL